VGLTNCHVTIASLPRGRQGVIPNIGEFLHFCVTRFRLNGRMDSVLRSIGLRFRTFGDGEQSYKTIQLDFWISSPKKFWTAPNLA